MSRHGSPVHANPSIATRCHGEEEECEGEEWHHFRMGLAKKIPESQNLGRERMGMNECSVMYDEFNSSSLS